MRVREIQSIGRGVGRIFAAAIFAGGALASSGAAWNYAGVGDWNVAGNWKENVVPTGGAWATNDVGTIRLAEGAVTIHRLYLGSSRTGELLLSGGTLTVNNQFGVGIGGTGKVTMTDGCLLLPGQFHIGSWSAGSFDFSGGVVTNNSWACIGRFSGGVGTMTVSGTAKWVNQSYTLFVAEEGTGTLTIRDGGEVANAPTAAGTYCIIGNATAGKGTLYLKTGGLLTVPGVEVRQAASTFVLDGGTLRKNYEKDGPIYGLGRFLIGAAGGTIDTGAKNTTVMVDLSDETSGSAGVLVKKGTGKLLLTSAGSFSGGYDVREGTLSAEAPANMPGWNAAPLTLAEGATLALGFGWTESDIVTLTNRANVTIAPGAILTTSSDPTKDYEINVASGGTRTMDGLSSSNRLVKTGWGTLVLTGSGSFAKGVVISNGYLWADQEVALGNAHITAVGSAAGAPALYAPDGNAYTAPVSTTGDGAITFSQYAGLYAAHGALDVNLGGKGETLSNGQDGFDVTDFLLYGGTGPLILRNPLNLNGKNWTVKSSTYPTILAGGLTNTSTSAGWLWHWGGNLLFPPLPNGRAHVSYRINNYSGNMIFSNAVVRMASDMIVGDSGWNSGVAKTTFLNSTKVSTGGWDYINGATGSVMTIDGGSYTMPNYGRFRIGGYTAGKTGRLVITNDAVVSLGALEMFSGWAEQSSGTVTFNAGDCRIGTNALFRAGSGLATYALSGGTLKIVDKVNLQIGACGQGLFWMTGGEVSASAYSCVGRYPGGVGELRVHGGTFTHRKPAKDNAALMFIAEQGTGTVSVANGGCLVSEMPSGIKISSTTGSRGQIILSPDGTAEVERFHGAGNFGDRDSALTFNGGTMKARGTTHTSDFIADTIKRVTVTPCGGVIDTAGLGNFTLKKALAKATEDDELSETILHRWCFNGQSLKDSVGTSDATVAGTVGWTDKAVRLLGTAQGTSSINLGTDVLPQDGRGFTIETWFTLDRHTHWARLWEFGPGKKRIWMSLNQGVGNPKIQLCVEGFLTIKGTYALKTATPYYAAVTFAPQPDRSWRMRLLLREAATGTVCEDCEESASAAWSPKILDLSTGCWLGHSTYTSDAEPACTIAEVRIAARAMTRDQMMADAVGDPEEPFYFSKRGGGSLTLTGANTYAVGTAVDGGTLTLADGATLPGTEIRVAKGATLALNATAQTASALTGEGTVSGGSLSVTGEIQPGGAGTVGTLTLASTALTGGTLVSEVGADGAADLLAVTGSLDLSGMSLRLANPAALDRSRTYTLLSAGGLTGAFKEVSGLPRRWHVEVEATRVRLTCEVGTLMILR